MALSAASAAGLTRRRHRPRPAATRAIPLLLALLLLAQSPSHSTAHPYLFRGANCTSHPTTALGKHDPPRPDPLTTFELRSPRGQVVTGLCPGVSYTLTVAFGAVNGPDAAPPPRKMLLTATVGKLGNSTAECPGREATGEMSARLRTTWAVPCFQQQQAGGASVVPVELRVTSATGAYGAYWQTRATVPLRLGCLSGACSRTRVSAAAGPAAPGGR